MWYIKVDLLRTNQLPKYIIFSGIEKVPKLKPDIQQQALNVYGNIFRKDDIVNMFFIQDTGQKHLDGKVGVISSYDQVNCCYVTKVSPTNQWRTCGSLEMLLFSENMEPYRHVRPATYSLTHQQRHVQSHLPITLLHLLLHCQP